MASIKPFVAFMPEPNWLQAMLERDVDHPNHIVGDPLKSVQGLLEPRQQTGQVLHTTRNRGCMQHLLAGKSYKAADAPAFYLYEQESFQGSQFGIWTLTSLDDFVQGKLLPHEETLAEHLDNLKTYRTVVGIEGRPILLAYERDYVIGSIIERVGSGKPVHSFRYRQLQHRLWSIDDYGTITALQKAFAGIKRTYVADGHHRLAAAAELHKQFPQWISTLYISAGQLRCREFNRTVKPNNAIDEKVFFAHLQQYGYITALPGNSAFSPEAGNRFGVCFRGDWYQYDLKPEWKEKGLPDVSFLQDFILKSLYGITDPRTDSQLQCWPASEWEQMLKYSRQDANAVVFTCRAMTASQLMDVANRKFSLPPKSTYMEPKIPYGLLICDHQEAGNSGVPVKQLMLCRKL